MVMIHVCKLDNVYVHVCWLMNVDVNFRIKEVRIQV